MEDLKQLRKIVEGFTKVNISKNSRLRSIIIARAIFFEAAAKKTPHSVAAIGSFLGKDHATVLHARKQFKGYMRDFPEFHSIYLQIIRMKVYGMTDEDMSQQQEECEKQVKDRKKHAEIILRLQEKISVLKRKLHERESVTSDQSHAPLVELVSKVPEHQVELVKVRLDAIVKMLPKN
ncbi:helix-turn-helix domain-containing protein [Salinimicrobium sp. GXAS 041]|uniref:helix-turn-helix domain-containing protein n=1 Tax=Salinimicrobium sp. GXAS 041 TaxID=3400806 RepID=UPI003C72CF0F